jgi:hypothetical protein
METRLGTITGNAEAPVGLPEAFDDHMTITYDLMHLAFQGDISRVFTFMIGHEASDRGYAHIGIPETHHSISHHGNDAEKLAKYAKLCTYQIVKFSEFLDKLKSTKDADGNLLDHSLLYWGSGMSNGNQHDRSNPPAVLVGGAHGRMKGNRSHHHQGRADGEPAARHGPPGRRGDRQAWRQHGTNRSLIDGGSQDPPYTASQQRPAVVAGLVVYGEREDMKQIFIGAMLVLASARIMTAQPASCAPSGGLTFICGVTNAEDLVLVPNSRWMLASGMAPGSGLHLVDTRAKTVKNLYAAGAAATRADRTKYAGCPGPLDAKQALLHGLSLRSAAAAATRSMRPITVAVNRSKSSSSIRAARRQLRPGSAASWRRTRCPSTASPRSPTARWSRPC